MAFFLGLAGTVRKVISCLENSRAPFYCFVLTFFFAITLRNFLESFSAHCPIAPGVFAHYYLSYVSLAISIILLFWLATRENILKIARVVLPFFLVTNIAPIVDLALTAGKGHSITYLIPGIHYNLIWRFFTFTGGFGEWGVTAGIKVEGLIVLVAAFAYFLVKNHNLGRNQNLTKSLFYTIALYALVFCYFAILFPIKFGMDFAGIPYERLSATAPYAYLVLIFLGGIALAYLAKSAWFKSILKERQLLRLAHFELMFVLGIVFGLYGNTMFRLQAIHVFWFAVTIIAIALACFYSMFSNNLADLEMDRASKKKTSVATGAISQKQYWIMALISLFAGLFYAAMVSFKTFFILLLFAGNYFLYSMPPLRLKRVPILSKALISLNSLALVMLGFIFVTGNLADFPSAITGIFLIGFTLAINFIDLKDFEGDKKAGIKTLPVLLGMKKAKLVIGIFFAATCLSFCLVIKETWALAVLAGLAAAQFLLINRKRYSEKPVLFLYILSIIVLIAYLLGIV